MSSNATSPVRQTVSQFYGLNALQPSLEFVDVDLEQDTRLFVDPQAIRHLGSPWSEECTALLQSFFDRVLEAIRHDDQSRARRLLSTLSEPRETRLGLAKGSSNGSGVGRGLADDLWESLRASRAVASGVIEDLEDTILFVEGIGHDRISDITTNIIRGPLIQFTLEAADYYSMGPRFPVRCPVWDLEKRSWVTETHELPVPNHAPLLLVPKSIVRARGVFDAQNYSWHYALGHYQRLELDDPRSELVQIVRKTRTKKVTKKAVKEKYGLGKDVNLQVTLAEPKLLDQYRKDKATTDQPLDHDAMAAAAKTPDVDWGALVAELRRVPTGREYATAYHTAVHNLLAAVFYPALTSPKREQVLHEGRKRIDISYTNVAQGGFFEWLHRTAKVPCTYIPTEVKNYTSPLGNPELDQLTGRLGVNRGTFGILCYRGIGDPDTVLARCKDALHDRRGHVITLADDDLIRLAEERVSSGVEFPLLFERFRQLVH